MALDLKGPASYNPTTIIIATFLVIMLVGCQTVSSTHTGRTVSEGNKILIASGGPHPHTFTTRDMTVSFRYKVQQGELHVSGSLDVKYSRVDKLTMTLFYLDGDGTVIDYYQFYSRAQKVKMGKVMDNTFDRTFDIPVDAKAFSIGYIGHTPSGKRGKSWVFRYSPFQ